MTKRTVDYIALEKKADRDWSTDPAIRNEFSSKEAYHAWLKAEAQGRAHVLTRGAAAQS